MVVKKAEYSGILLLGIMAAYSAEMMVVTMVGSTAVTMVGIMALNSVASWAVETVAKKAECSAALSVRMWAAYSAELMVVTTAFSSADQMDAMAPSLVAV